MAAHYIVVHGEPRKVSVTATVLDKNSLISNWKGNIYVDNPSYGCSNEDPFVFNNPWLYSYCKINFIRKNYRADDVYLKNGSYIFFANNQLIKRNILVIDTVFVVNNIQDWVLRSRKIPAKYLSIQCDTSSILWERHFKFGVENGICNAIYQHPGDKTVEAQLYNNEINEFSFLPYKENELIKLPFSCLPNDVCNKLDNLNDKRTKYPVLIDNNEKNTILSELNNRCDLKILKDIK